MLVTLLVKFRIKGSKTTELGLLLQVLPVCIVTFVEPLHVGSHLKWTGPVKQFESFMLQRLNLSIENVQSKSNNCTCMVWKTPNATFNFYFKTKTLQVQGKATEHKKKSSSFFGSVLSRLDGQCNCLR